MSRRASGLGCDQIVAALRAVLPDLRQRYGVAEMSVFGSRARDENTAASDVDLLVAFDRPIGFFSLIALEDEQSHPLSLRVDVVLNEALPPGVRREVLREARPV